MFLSPFFGSSMTKQHNAARPNAIRSAQRSGVQQFGETRL